MGRVGGILVGGRAKRLGAISKGNLKLGKDTLIERTVNLLRPLCDEIFLLGHRPDYDYLGLRYIDDTIGHGGPVTGIASVLALTQANLLVTPCDLPFLTTKILARLTDHEQRTPRACRGPLRTHPLIAFYPSTVAAVVGQCAEKQLSAHQTFEACAGKWIDFAESQPFTNVNTAEDWADAQRVYELLSQHI